jgi:hypothetical protein
MTKLQPCPFSGKAPTVFELLNGNFLVACSKDCACMIQWWSKKSNAVRAWDHLANVKIRKPVSKIEKLGEAMKRFRFDVPNYVIKLIIILIPLFLSDVLTGSRFCIFRLLAIVDLFVVSLFLFFL